MIKKLFLALNALLLGIFVSCSDKSNEPDDKGEPYYKLYFASANPKYTVLVSTPRLER